MHVAYCLKGISEQKEKRDKRLEKNWSSLRFKIEKRNNRKGLKSWFL